MIGKSLGISFVLGASLGAGYFKTFDSVEQRSKKLGKTWSETNKKLGATGDVIKYKNTLEQLRKKQANLGRSSAKLDRGIAEVERRYKAAKRAARGYGIEVGSVTREQKKLQRELKKTERLQRANERKQRAGQRLGDMRGKAMGMAGAIYGMSRLAGNAMDVEEQGLYLRTVINSKDGDKDAAVGRAMKHARSFSRNSLASDKEVLDIEYALNSAGLSEEVAREGTELVHKLAKITKGAPEQVGEIIGVTFNNMADGMDGSTKEKMDRIGNILAKTQMKFQIRDFGQLGESMKYAAASAVAAKVPLAQTAAVIGLLNSAGLQGSMAGTAFSSVLKNMSKASDELGFSIVRGNDGQMDMIATLEELGEATDGMDIDERNDMLQEQFGDEGKRGIIPLLEKLAELKEANKEIVAIADGRLVSDTYDRFLKSKSGQWLMLKQNAAQVGEVFAGTLLPALNAVISPLAKGAGLLAENIEKYPILGKILGAVALGLGGVGAAMGIATAATWAWNSALLANPFVWMVGAVVAGAALIIMAWEPVKKWFSEFGDDIGAWIGFTPLGNIINGINGLSGYFGDDETTEVAASKKPVLSKPVSVTPAPLASASNVKQENNNQYNIYQQPGEDGEAFAQRVAALTTTNNSPSRESKPYG